jgi:hypothetical protein
MATQPNDDGVMPVLSGRSYGPLMDRLRAWHAVALLAPIAVLTACTGGSSGAHVAQLSATATNLSSSSGSPAAPAQGTGALAFARCMRTHGLPNWPDPESNGVFDKSKLQQAGYSVAQTRAAEDGPCKNILPTQAPTASQTITAQQQQDYLNAVACMRSHGITDFPDPTFSGGHVTLVPPPGIDTNGTEFTAAQHICQQLIPAGLPYSGSDDG